MVSTEVAVTVVMGVVVVAVATAVARMENWRTYTVLGRKATVGGEPGRERDHPAKPGGLTRWLTTVDHKDIGILYGAFALVAFAVAGLMAVLIRLQLVVPSGAVVGENFYNAIMTSHGITMLFLFGTPILAAFSNYLVPLLIGADDMALPRINAIAFWLLPPAALLIWGGFLIPGVAPSQTGWTMYAPLSRCGAVQAAQGAACQAQVSPGVDAMLLGLHLSGVSATMGAINFIATIVTERGEDVGWANLDIFSWTVLTQSGIILFAFPLLGSALVMLLLDRNVGTTFFAVESAGPMLWQHLFWFFGHPEVYILVLPPMGIVSYVLPRFAGRELFGFEFVVYSTLAIGVLSFGVWAHHMFTTGMDPRLRASFMAVSLAIAVPSAVKTFNWITTMWNGRLRLTAPMLFCIGFVANFILGGVTGVFVASIPVDLLVHDTYYVVGHFHYIVMGAIGFAAFAGIYYWFPIVTGKTYQRTLARWHFWLSMVGTNVTFFAMLVLGYLGMPRRYATYELDGAIAPLAQVTAWHQIATAGALLLLVGQIVFVWNIVQSWIEGPTTADGDPWDLRRADMVGREYAWFDRERSIPLADGSGDADGDGGDWTDASGDLTDASTEGTDASSDETDRENDESDASSDETDRENDESDANTDENDRGDDD